MDVSGEQGGDISLAKNGHLHKTRLDSRGQRLNVAEYISPRHWGFTLHKPRAVCPLPVACLMIKNAEPAVELVLTLPFLQEITALNKAFEDKEGCRVEGWLDVQRVAGNFHVAVHMEDYVMLDRVRLPCACALMLQLSTQTDHRSTALSCRHKRHWRWPCATSAWTTLCSPWGTKMAAST